MSSRGRYRYPPHLLAPLLFGFYPGRRPSDQVNSTGGNNHGIDNRNISASVVPGAIGVLKRSTPSPSPYQASLPQDCEMIVRG